MLKKLLGAGIACLSLFAMTSLSDAQYQGNQAGTTPPGEQKQFQKNQASSQQQDLQDESRQPYASDTSTQTGQQYPTEARPGTQQPIQQQQQTQAKSEQKQSESKGKAASMYLDGKEIMDSRVKDRNGNDVGSVSNLILDRTGRVTYVIVSSGGFFGYGGKKVSIPAEAVTITQKEKNREITLNVDKEHLDSAPEYNNLANLDNALYVDTVHRFFGLQPRWNNRSMQQQGQFQSSQQPMQGQSQQNQWKFQEYQASENQQESK